MGSLYGPTYGIGSSLEGAAYDSTVKKGTEEGAASVAEGPRLVFSDRITIARTTGAEAPGPHQRSLTETVQLKLRFSEALRRKLEREADLGHRSLNAEIIKRLEASFISPDRLPGLIADALLNGLHPDVEDALRDKVIEDYRSDEAAMSYDWREEQADFEGK